MQKIHSKTTQILKKVLNFKIKEKDLNIVISEKFDSLQFVQLLIETEKLLKKKIPNHRIKTLNDINKLFLK